VFCYKYSAFQTAYVLVFLVFIGCTLLVFIYDSTLNKASVRWALGYGERSAYPLSGFKYLQHMQFSHLARSQRDSSRDQTLSGVPPMSFAKSIVFVEPDDIFGSRQRVRNIAKPSREHEWRRPSFLDQWTHGIYTLALSRP
jgi:hypothetical protein